MRVAVIPARGGSRRIPRKNIKPFCGRPIVAYSISAAKASGLFDRVIVSTEDAEIADVARQCGAEVPFVRPAELADDRTATVPVIRHAVQWIERNLGPVEHACCIYPAAPFVQAASLREAYDRLVKLQVSGYVVSATTFPAPIQRAFTLDEAGRVRMFWPGNYGARSQDLETAYHDAGQFYWGSAAAYLSGTIFLSPESVAHVLPRSLVQDIDTPEDWDRAESMYRVLRERGDLG
jgi:pseudaminic acid cytidylyltransferase